MSSNLLSTQFIQKFPQNRVFFHIAPMELTPILCHHTKGVRKSEKKSQTYVSDPFPLKTKCTCVQSQMRTSFLMEQKPILEMSFSLSKCAPFQPHTMETHVLFSGSIALWK